MEAEILKICGVAVICTVAVMILSGFGSSSGVVGVLKVCGLALCLGGTVVLLGSAVDKIMEIADMGAGTEYVALMLRGLGICVLCRISSDICRESGQAGVASAVESAGRLALVLLALPVINDIIAFAKDFAEGI